jgi:hypothetical protein
MPAMAIPTFSFSTGASVVDTGGCVNSTVGPSQTTSSSVEQPTQPAPIVCTSGLSNGDSIRYGALAESNGTLSVLAEYATIGATVTTPISMTATATLTDTLTFSCAGCTPGEPIGTAALVSSGIDGGIFNNFISPSNADANVTYTATVSDPTDGVSATSTYEFCPDPPITNCTVDGTGVANPVTVTTPFALYAGDSYSISVTLTAFVELIAGDTSSQALGANMNDPISFTVPGNVDISSASDQFTTPEPSSWMLMGGGLTLCFLLFRCRLAVK